MPRLFFALLPNEDAKHCLQQLSHSLALPLRQRTRAENWHVTLVFIGQVPQDVVPALINSVLAINTAPMLLEFNQLEYWRKSGIVCLSCTNIAPSLLQLVSSLTTPLLELGLTLDQRPYYPHLTLARRVQKQPLASFKPIYWYADQFALVESVTTASGVMYQPLKYWKLSSAGG